MNGIPMQAVLNGNGSRARVYCPYQQKLITSSALEVAVLALLNSSLGLKSKRDILLEGNP